MVKGGWDSLGTPGTGHEVKRVSSEARGRMLGFISHIMGEIDPNTPTAQMPCADGHWPQGFLQGPSSVPPSPRPALGLCGPRPHTGKRRGPAGGPQHLLLCVMGRGPSWSLPTTTSSRLFRRQCPVPASTPASGPKSPPLGLLRNPSSPAAGSGKSEAPGPPGLH